MHALKQAIEHINRRNYAEALRLLQQLGAARSKDPNLLGLYGYANLKAGNFDAAESSLGKALKKHPHDTKLLNTLCNLYIQRSELSRAESVAKRCLRIDPKNKEAAFNLGSIYYRMHRYRDAETQFESAVQLDPANENAFVFLGLICKNQLRFKTALDYFDRALALNPTSVEALQNKGVVLNGLLRSGQAADCLREANTLRPNNATICHNLASAYVLSGDTEQARHYFNEAIRLEPLNHEHHHWYNLFLWRKQSEDFLRSYEDVLSTHADAHVLRPELVSKLRLAGRLEEAEAQVSYLIRNQGQEPENYRLKGEVHREQRRFSEALDAHIAAHRLDSKSPVIRESLATSHLSLGHAADALQIIDRLTQSSPEHQGYWALKAIALRLLGSEEYHYLYNYDQLVLKVLIDPPESYSSLQQFNEELLQELYKHHSAETQPLDQSLLNGTQSVGDLFNEAAEIIQSLKAQFDAQMSRFLARLPVDEKHPVLARNKRTFAYTGAWSVMLRSSGFHVNHYHTHGWYSGPYYVHLPEEVKQSTGRDGWIKLGEPGFEMSEPLETDHVIEPEEGLMIRFPSYMWHGTYPFSSNEKRVIVACDMLP